MSTYEQAVSLCNVARAEIERINHAIYQVQQTYNHLNDEPPRSDGAKHQWERQKTHLARETIELVHTRNRWLEIRFGAEQTIQQALVQRPGDSTSTVPFQAMPGGTMAIGDARTADEMQAVLLQDEMRAEQQVNTRRINNVKD